MRFNQILSFWFLGCKVQRLQIKYIWRSLSPHHISLARANIKSGSIIAADYRSIISFSLHFHYISLVRANIKGISGSIIAADCRSIVLYKMIIISLCTEQTQFN